MSRAKQAWMEQQEEEWWDDKVAYIREQLGDPEATESTDGWQRYSDEYDMVNVEPDVEDEWGVQGRGRHELFLSNIEAAMEIILTPLSEKHLKRRLVMLHAHVVASLEAYLFTTFLHHALSSDSYMALLVEHDDVLAKHRFTLKDYFSKPDWFRKLLASHLKVLVFHNVGKIAPLYRNVLGIDFGDVAWLARAVHVRHDCVHRAGYDPDGNAANLTREGVDELINQSLVFVKNTEAAVYAIEHIGDKKTNF